MAWALGTSGGPEQSPLTHLHKMLSVAAAYQAHPSMTQLLLALRLTGPHAQCFVVSACPSGRYLHSMGPKVFGGIHGIFSKTVFTQCRCHHVPGESVNDSVAFGPKSLRPSSSIRKMCIIGVNWQSISGPKR